MPGLVPKGIEQDSILGRERPHRSIEICLSPLDHVHRGITVEPQPQVTNGSGIGPHTLDNLRATQVVEKLGKYRRHVSHSFRVLSLD